MKKVLIVNGPEVECGIYQYGLATYNILKKSEKNSYDFFATNNDQEFLNKAQDYEVIVYNHNPSTLSWLNNGITRPLHNKGKKQIVIYGHEHKNRFIGIDAYIVTDPSAKVETDEYNDIVPLKIYDNIHYTEPSSVLRIGTSGISNRTKNVTKIIDIINDQFDEDVILNLHVSDGKFVDPSGNLSQSLIDTVKNRAKKNVQIDVVRGFLEKDDLVYMLNQNDINLYWYDTPNVPGVSGSINRAIEAKKPFGVNESSFFSHVRRDYNDLTKTSIKDIVDKGYEPFKEFLEMWNPEKFIQNYDSIIEKI